MRHLVLYMCALFALIAASAATSFELANDRFVLDGKAVQVISGSLHYQRVHPAYWRDRLLRLQALGCNAVSFYVPWNTHAPAPGKYVWEGFADVEGYLRLIDELGMKVLLRLGPYICGEWDFGGFPWWLASSQVHGGRNMTLRSDDPDYLSLVDRWWGEMLPRMRPFLIENSGPVLFVQIENELGFLQGDSNQRYLRHLLATVRQHLGDQVIVSTVDPPTTVQRGTLPGDEVFTTVDSGAGWFDLEWSFGQQRSFNPPGKSPPIFTEYYTGWLTFWGEKMANTSIFDFTSALSKVLDYRNGTGNVNLYMAHGGTNFGWSAGGTGGDADYKGIITSYDYDAPLSESGEYGQPGIGGPNKFEASWFAAIRQVMQKRGYQLPAAPAPIPAAAYGQVPLQRLGSLLSLLPTLSGPIHSEQPRIMEDYGQGGGLIVYQTNVSGRALGAASRDFGALLKLGQPIRDYATVLLDGKPLGRLDRNGPANLTIRGSALPGLDQVAELSIVAEAVGRANEGWRFDVKGLASPLVTLDGQQLTGWRAWPLPLDNVQQLPKESVQDVMHRSGPQPAFYRGVLNVSSSADPVSGLLPDTYLDMRGWGKGVAFINGFNLGWFWPEAGPVTSLYVPGPLLQQGPNDLILLGVLGAPSRLAVNAVDTPNFFGEGGEQQVQQVAAPSSQQGGRIALPASDAALRQAAQW